MSRNEATSSSFYPVEFIELSPEESPVGEKLAMLLAIVGVVFLVIVLISVIPMTPLAGIIEAAK